VTYFLQHETYRNQHIQEKNTQLFQLLKFHQQNQYLNFVLDEIKEWYRVMLIYHNELLLGNEVEIYVHSLFQHLHQRYQFELFNRTDEMLKKKKQLLFCLFSSDIQMNFFIKRILTLLNQ
jgi:hypothetical protein